jgi:hypothetical protein
MESALYELQSEAAYKSKAFLFLSLSSLNNNDLLTFCSYDLQSSDHDRNNVRKKNRCSINFDLYHALVILQLKQHLRRICSSICASINLVSSF